MRKGSKHSPTAIQKMCNSQSNRSNNTLEKMSKSKIGERNPMFGRDQSQETRDKIRNALKGKYTGEKSSRFGKTGEQHPMFGKHFSKEVHEKMSKAKRGEKNTFYGKHHSKETREKLRKDKLGKPISDETRKKLSQAFSKDKNPAWRGGTSFYPYCEKFDKKRRKAVRDFFNNECICCGKKGSENITKRRPVELSVHHIDHDKEQGCSGKPFNLVPLCAEHHTKEQHNEEEYKAYINKTLREGFKWGIWNEQEYMEKVMY